MVEIWKDIEGYEGLYQVSNLGNVRSLDKEVCSVNVYGEYTMIRKGKILKQNKNKDGYYVVKLQHNKAKKTCLVHRLVAIAFINQKDGLDYVNHIDENKANNSVDNLEWVSHIENCNHATRNKRISEKHYKKVMSININTGYKQIYNSLKETSDYGFNSNMVSSVINGYKKTHKGHIFKLLEEEVV